MKLNSEEINKIFKKGDIVVSKKLYISSETVYANLRLMDHLDIIDFDNMENDIKRFVQKPRLMIDRDFFEHYIALYKTYYPEAKVYTDMELNVEEVIEVKLDMDQKVFETNDKKLASNRVMIKNRVLVYSAFCAFTTFFLGSTLNAMLQNFTFGNSFFIFLGCLLISAFLYNFYLDGYDRKYIIKYQYMGYDIKSMKELEGFKRLGILQIVGSVIGCFYSTILVLVVYVSIVDMSMFMLCYVFSMISVILLFTFLNYMYYNKNIK